MFNQLHVLVHCQQKLTTMSQGTFMILAALLVGSKAYSINPSLLYGFPGAYNPYGPGKKGYEEPAPLQLTCSAVFTAEDPKLGRVVEAIAANFKDKSAVNLGAGFPYGVPYNPLYGGLGTAFGQSPFGGPAGISADIEVYTSLGGKPLTLMLTERGYSGGGCIADNFGESLIPGHDKKVSPVGYSSFFAGGLGLGAGAGVGAGVGVGAGAGYGSTGYGSTGYGISGPQQVFPGKAGYGPVAPIPGVLAELNINPGTLKAIKIDRVDGFISLQELAGRGIIGCTEVDTEYDGRAKCVGIIPFCCSLSYDNQNRALQLAY